MFVVLTAAVLLQWQQWYCNKYSNHTCDGSGVM